MCKTWSIKYSCEHIFKFRLSTCRGTFTAQSKPTRDPKPACSTAPLLTVKSQSNCGPCERARIEDAMAERLASLRLQVEFDDDGFSVGIGDVEEKIADFVEEQAKLQFRLSGLYPGEQRFKKFRYPEKGERMTLPVKSPLRKEVLREEVDLEADSGKEAEDEAAAAYFDDWAQPWDAGGSLTSEAAAGIATWMTEDEGETTVVENPISWDVEAVDETKVMIFQDPVLVQDHSGHKARLIGDMSLEPSIKEPEPVHLAPTIRTILADDDKENINLSFEYKPKAVAPHLRRGKSFTDKQKTASESGKCEIDLLERIRCFQTWIVVSS